MRARLGLEIDDYAVVFCFHEVGISYLVPEFMRHMPWLRFAFIKYKTCVMINGRFLGLLVLGLKSGVVFAHTLKELVKRAGYFPGNRDT